MARRETLTDIAAIGAAGLMGFREGRQARRQRELEERQEARAERREDAELARARAQEAREERILAAEEARERRAGVAETRAEAEERRRATAFGRAETEAAAEAERAGKKFGMEEREGAEKVRQGAAATLFNLSRVWEDLPEGRMTGLVFDSDVKAALGLKFPGRTVTGMTKKADGLVTLTFTEGAPEDIDPLILRDTERGLMSPESQKLALVLEEARRPPGLKAQVEAEELTVRGREARRKLSGIEPSLSRPEARDARRDVMEVLRQLKDKKAKLTPGERKLKVEGIFDRAQGAGLEWGSIAGELTDDDRSYMAKLATEKGMDLKTVLQIAPPSGMPSGKILRGIRRKVQEKAGIVGAGVAGGAIPTTGIAGQPTIKLPPPKTFQEAYNGYKRTYPDATREDILEAIRENEPHLLEQ